MTGGERVELGATADAAPTYQAFVEGDGARLRRVACARFGIDVGAEATADALAWAWEHWPEVQAMANPVGYLYRVAQSSVRRQHRWRRPVGLPVESRDELRAVEPGLEVALAGLRPARRVAVVLVHGLGWSYQEAADAMGVPVTAVTNHVHRGLADLRRALGEGP